MTEQILGREINSLTTKIDEVTGLASVPEDMFWRITELPLDTGDTGSKDVGAVKMTLFRKVESTIPEKEMHHWTQNNFWKHFFTGQARTKVTEVEPAKTETIEKELCHINLLMTCDQIPKDTKHEWTPYTYFRRMYYSNDTNDKKFYRVIPATPDNLRDKSVVVWEFYMTQQHEKALEMDRRLGLERVLGDYPPKSVKDLVDA
jgi:hypothetical protein